MTLTGPVFPFLSEAVTTVALQLLVLLTSLISLLISHQQFRNLNIQNGKKISRPLVINFIFQLFITVIVINNYFIIVPLQYYYLAAIPFLINVSLCLLIWVWSFPKNQIKNDLPLGIYIFFAFLFYLFELSFRYIIQIKNFNTTSFFVSLLTFLSILFILACMLLLLIKRNTNWLAGILFGIF